MDLAKVIYKNNIITTLTDREPRVGLQTAGAYIENNIQVQPLITEFSKKAYPNYLCFTANEANSTISMGLDGTPTLGQNFQISTDRLNWITFIPQTSTITLANIGDKVYFKGNNPNGINESLAICYYFIMTGSISASGNIMSLIDNGACTCTIIPNNYCFQSLFDFCTALTTAPELPATSLTNYCYAYMFNRCTSLVAPPILPATILANSCYIYMFQYCKQFETPAIMTPVSLADYCCKGMYVGCTGLTGKYILPDIQMATECYRDFFALAGDMEVILPSMYLANACYKGMFYNNTKLTHVPKLPATTLAVDCYSLMFAGCTSLYVSDSSITEATQAWKIPNSGTFANTYAQNNMFKDCLGTRASDTMPGATSAQYTYYTQNPPV